MKTHTATLLTAVMAAVVTAPVSAAEYVWARVLEVKPVVRVVRVYTPVRECRAVEVVRYAPYTDPAGAAVAGAVIGAIVGNQIGSGDGRRVATGAGAIIGGKSFHRRAQRMNRPIVTTEHRCSVVDEVREVERDGGYRVTYEYAGRAFVTNSRHHPGNRIRVRVELH